MSRKGEWKVKERTIRKDKEKKIRRDPGESGGISLLTAVPIG
jgi:hypothetical protein